MSRGRALVVAAGLTGAAGLAAVAVGCALSAPRWRGPVRPNFDGRRFRSIEPLDERFSRFLRWMTHRERGPWRDFTNTPPGARPPAGVSTGGLGATFVSNPTGPVKVRGLTLLTDPVCPARVAPVSMAG